MVRFPAPTVNPTPTVASVLADRLLACGITGAIEAERMDALALALESAGRHESSAVHREAAEELRRAIDRRVPVTLVHLPLQAAEVHGG